MPSESPKQARFMAAVAHNPDFAKKVGVPQSVGKEFNQADKGGPMLRTKRYKAGGRISTDGADANPGRADANPGPDAPSGGLAGFARGGPVRGGDTRFTKRNPRND